jgi:hypothetical protein
LSVTVFFIILKFLSFDLVWLSAFIPTVVALFSAPFVLGTNPLI